MGVLRQLPHRRLLLHKLLCDFPDFWFVERPELCSQFGELVAFAVAVGAVLQMLRDIAEVLIAQLAMQVLLELGLGLFAAAIGHEVLPVFVVV